MFKLRLIASLEVDAKGLKILDIGEFVGSNWSLRSLFSKSLETRKKACKNIESRHRPYCHESTSSHPITEVKHG